MAATENNNNLKTASTTTPWSLIINNIGKFILNTLNKYTDRNIEITVPAALFGVDGNVTSCNVSGWIDSKDNEGNFPNVLSKISTTNLTPEAAFINSDYLTDNSKESKNYLVEAYGTVSVGSGYITALNATSNTALKYVIAGSIEADNGYVTINADDGNVFIENDSEVEPSSGYYFSVTGKGDTKITKSGWLEENTITSNESTHYYTIKSATFSSSLNAEAGEVLSNEYLTLSDVDTSGLSISGRGSVSGMINISEGYIEEVSENIDKQYSEWSTEKYITDIKIPSEKKLNSITLSSGTSLTETSIASIVLNENSCIESIDCLGNLNEVKVGEDGYIADLLLTNDTIILNLHGEGIAYTAPNYTDLNKLGGLLTYELKDGTSESYAKLVNFNIGQCALVDNINQNGDSIVANYNNSGKIANLLNLGTIANLLNTGIISKYTGGGAITDYSNIGTITNMINSRTIAKLGTDEESRGAININNNTYGTIAIGNTYVKTDKEEGNYFLIASNDFAYVPAGKVLSAMYAAGCEGTTVGGIITNEILKAGTSTTAGGGIGTLEIEGYASIGQINIYEHGTITDILNKGTISTLTNEKIVDNLINKYTIITEEIGQSGSIETLNNLSTAYGIENYSGTGSINNYTNTGIILLMTGGEREEGYDPLYRTIVLLGDSDNIGLLSIENIYSNSELFIGDNEGIIENTTNNGDITIEKNLKTITINTNSIIDSENHIIEGAIDINGGGGTDKGVSVNNHITTVDGGTKVTDENGDLIMAEITYSGGTLSGNTSISEAINIDIVDNDEDSVGSGIYFVTAGSGERSAVEQSITTAGWITNASNGDISSIVSGNFTENKYYVKRITVAPNKKIQISDTVNDWWWEVDGSGNVSIY